MGDRSIAIICCAVGVILCIVLALLGQWILGLIVLAVSMFVSDMFSWEAEKNEIAERKKKK